MGGSSTPRKGRAGAEGELAAAEDHLAAARQQPAVEPVPVLTARVALESAPTPRKGRAGAEGELAAAEDHLAAARQQPAVEPVPVLTARVALESAHRVLEAAREDLAAAGRSAAGAPGCRRGGGTTWPHTWGRWRRRMARSPGASPPATKPSTSSNRPGRPRPPETGSFHTDPDSPRQPRRVRPTPAKEA